ncbi:MAG: EcsC family protein [Nitrospiraceae bacterium]|nr:EcsC family protein [Nitrospiraceae bacterium]
MMLSDEHFAELAEAKRLLENPGLAVKITNFVGKPIEKGFELLPDNWGQRIGVATKDALMFAMKGALLTMDSRSSESHPRWHKVAAAVSGAAGGALGLAGLIAELLVSTTIMCRSIADIARANGESLDDVSTRLACIEVFALGGTSRRDDAAEIGYFAVRSSLARAVSEAAEYLASQALAEESAPALVRLIALIASRFQIQVSEKAAAQLVPIIGAAGGAVVNLLFIDHFQDMSRGHFTVRRLERHYGTEEVRRAYERI